MGKSGRNIIFMHAEKASEMSNQPLSSILFGDGIDYNKYHEGRFRHRQKDFGAAKASIINNECHCPALCSIPRAHRPALKAVIRRERPKDSNENRCRQCSPAGPSACVNKRSICNGSPRGVRFAFREATIILPGIIICEKPYQTNSPTQRCLLRSAFAIFRRKARVMGCSSARRNRHLYNRKHAVSRMRKAIYRHEA